MESPTLEQEVAAVPELEFVKAALGLTQPLRVARSSWIGTSRMSRDAHVRFGEGRGVNCPRILDAVQYAGSIYE